MSKTPLKRLTLALLLGVSFFPPGVQAGIRGLDGEAAVPLPASGAVLLAQDEEGGGYEEPAAEEPAAEEPAAEEPAAEEPAYEEPAAEEPAAGEPGTEDVQAEEPAAEEPASEEPAAEQAEEPAVEEEAPAAEEQSGDEAGEPAAEEPAADEAEAPAEADEVPAAEEQSDDQQDEQPAAEDEQTDTDEPATDEAESPADEDAAPAAEDQSSDQAEQPAAEDGSGEDAEQPAAEGEQSDTDEPATDEAESPADEDAAPAAEDQSSDQAEQPAAEDESGEDAEQPAAEDEQTDTDSDTAEEDSGSDDENAAAAVEEEVEDPEADAAVEAAVEEEADQPLVEEGAAEAEDEDTLLGEEGLSDDEVTPDEVASEVEEAAAEEPQLDADGELAEPVPADDGVSAGEVAPLFDSVKRDERDTVDPDEASEAPPPVSDAAAQAFAEPEDFGRDDRFGNGEALAEAPLFEAQSSNNTTVVYNENNTTIYQSSSSLYIDSRSSYEQRLSSWGYSDFTYQRYSGGYYSERARARDGSFLITSYDRYGNVIGRTWRDRGGRSYVLGWYDTRRGPIRFEDVGRKLPPLKPRFPAAYYVLDYRGKSADVVYRFLLKPPVERARRLYSIDEVKRSPRLRDTLPRIEIGNLNFATGSAKLARNQAGVLKALAAAMLKQIRANPAETFLIEGHTDAVGSTRSNLILSDRRARAVAEALSRYYRVPPQNLYTQGYGEQFLKVRTAKASAANRRVAIRRTTPLVTAAAKRK